MPECLSRMVALAEEHPSVGIVGAYRIQGNHVGLSGLPYPQAVFSGYGFAGQPWSKGYVFLDRLVQH
jgi:hypothetical protein